MPPCLILIKQERLNKLNTKKEDLKNLMTDTENYYYIPRILLTEPYRENLSNEAIILYTYLLDLYFKAEQNEQVDSNNNVYIAMTREELSNLLNVGTYKTVKCLKELVDIDLIEEKNIGQGKPKRIYLLEVDL